MNKTLSEKTSDYLEQKLQQKKYKVDEIREIFQNLKQEKIVGANYFKKSEQIYLKKIQAIEQEQQRRRNLLENLLLDVNSFPLRYLVFGANGQKALKTLEKNDITTLGQVIKKLKEEGDEGLLQLPGFYKQKLFYLKEVLKEHKISYTRNLQLTGS